MERPDSIQDTQLRHGAQRIEACRLDKGFYTCMQCEDVVECNIRYEYVKGVYSHMNKGKNMDFVF